MHGSMGKLQLLDAENHDVHIGELRSGPRAGSAVDALPVNLLTACELRLSIAITAVCYRNTMHQSIYLIKAK
jgi:hypothetical protein